MISSFNVRSNDWRITGAGPYRRYYACHALRRPSRRPRPTAEGLVPRGVDALVRARLANNDIYIEENLFALT
jgi:hypothetical protein